MSLWGDVSRPIFSIEPLFLSDLKRGEESFRT